MRTQALPSMLLAALLATPAAALDYQGGAFQFGGSFNPGNAPYGGFGGGSCTATKTPIVFLHGNGDEAKNWDYPSSTGGQRQGAAHGRPRLHGDAIRL